MSKTKKYKPSQYDHPSYEEMILQAVENVTDESENKKGAVPKKIYEYILENFDVPQTTGTKTRAKRVLKQLFEENKLTKPTPQRYKLTKKIGTAKSRGSNSKITRSATRNKRRTRSSLKSESKVKKKGRKAKKKSEKKKKVKAKRKAAVSKSRRSKRTRSKK